MIKLLTIIGARPQIIKAAALSRAIKNSFSDKIVEKILHTGQHYDDNMSEVFFRELGIPNPEYNLGIGSYSHGEQTAKMIMGVEQVLQLEKFDAVVLYGDTNSTLAGAVAAAKLQVPIIHIEAGLRSYNMAMPEEQNRIVCDQLSSMLFAPTQTAIDNLYQEGFFRQDVRFSNQRNRHVFNSGDIMYDNSMYYASVAESKTDILAHNSLEKDEYVLVTVHRDANTDNPDRLNSIFEALLTICENEAVKMVLPLHPRTSKLLEQKLSSSIYQKLLAQPLMQIIPPASFFEIITLEKNAKLIMTDSGGVQKEAYFFEKPCVIFREETEWLEIIDAGTGILAGADSTKIKEAYHSLTMQKHEFPSLFGDAHAAEFILDKILQEFGK